MTDEHHREERLKRELLWMTNDELEEYLEAEPTERPRRERILLIEMLAEVLGGGRRVQDRAWARCWYLLGKRQAEHDLLELLGMAHIHDTGVRFLTPEELIARLKEEPQDGEETGPFG